MMMSIVFVHVSGSHLRVVGVCVSVVEVKKGILIDAKVIRDLLGPVLDDLVLA
jgi:hypothetical protein